MGLHPGTNGGPGASSVAFGFWTEHGPFRLSRNATGHVVPELYDYSWNRIANVLYVEMPTGVGFSFSSDPEAYANITDDQAAFESHEFLRAFFKVFNQFKSNPFFVTGESYGGHYVPNLMDALIDEDLGLNIQGFLVGNPGINSDWYYNVDEFAFVTFLWSHGLIPADEYVKANNACGWNQFYVDCQRDFTHPSQACITATEQALRHLPTPLDFYDVLAPTCHSVESEDSDEALPAFENISLPFLRHLERKFNLDTTQRPYNPCLSKLSPEYVNQNEVLEAIHAKTNRRREWPSLPSGWSYNQGSLGEKKDIAKLFPRFFNERPKWKIWIVSGTADSAVPFIGTERWIGCLNRTRISYKAWYLKGDVGGMVSQYDRLTFVTVKGCGHTIPTYCPDKGFAFFANYLNASKASRA
ncbi:hypothetical protein AAMO2058_000987100 [Amorphochlora amoebiformis]